MKEIYSKKTDEGGFEPPILIQYAGFQDRYLKPLRHSSRVQLEFFLKCFDFDNE